MNLVQLLNGLSVSELKNTDIFESIIGSHYEKFRLLHEILLSIPNEVTDVASFTNSNTEEFKLSVDVCFPNNKVMKKFESGLIDSLEDSNSHRLEEFSFDYYTRDDSDIIVIDITSIYMTREDEDIYAY